MLSFDDMPAGGGGDAGRSAGPLPTGEGIMLTLQYDTNEQAEAAFAALSQDGQITMPLAPTFWTKRFGRVTDRFGVAWAVSGEHCQCPLPDCDTQTHD